MENPKKPKVGIFGLVGCMGCQLSILYHSDLFTILDHIDLAAFPAGKENNSHDSDFDIIFLEGSVVSKRDLEDLKKLRSRTKKLVSIGSCATDGCVPAIKNFVNNRNVELSVYKQSDLIHLESITPTPHDEHVHVDAYIRGCPMDKLEFLDYIKKTLLGEEFKTYEKPVCHDCNLRETGCLLERGIECMGPITRGNCSVVCPKDNYGCVGCRGPYTDANIKAYFQLLEDKGIDKTTIERHLNRFSGIRFRQMMQEKDNNNTEARK